jgi:hypothetical protein
VLSQQLRERRASSESEHQMNDLTPVNEKETGEEDVTMNNEDVEVDGDIIEDDNIEADEFVSSNVGCSFKALYNYKPKAEGDIILRKGEMYLVLEENTPDEGWGHVKHILANGDEESGEEGICPLNYLGIG